jgi:mono/diheme cytochrome c family protein
MAKRSFLLFILFFVALAIAVPYWALSKEGDPGASPEKVAASDQAAKELFETNCGSCHTLARAGTDGVVGPNLDDLLGDGTPEGNRPRVLNAIHMGVAGRMPAGILQGVQAEEVADFVARVAGQ